MEILVIISYGYLMLYLLINSMESKNSIGVTSPEAIKKAIKEANNQGAFVFWNHPNWIANRDDGIARLDKFHEQLLQKKLFHGIEVVNEHTGATGTTALKLRNDSGRGLFIDSDLAAGGYSVEIDSEHTTTNVAKIASIATSGTILEVSAAGVLTGDVINITADSATTGKGINMSMDALTTGSALYIDSDSSSTSARNIVEIIQNNASATSAVGIKVQQDGDAPAAVFEGSNVYVRQGSALQTLTTSSWVMGG